MFGKNFGPTKNKMVKHLKSKHAYKMLAVSLKYWYNFDTTLLAIFFLSFAVEWKFENVEDLLWFLYL